MNNRRRWAPGRRRDSQIVGHLSLSAVLFALSFGCAPRVTKQPDWPKQPSPAYPPVSENDAAAPQSVTSLEADPQKSSSDADPSGLLAKQYEGKSSLRTLRGKATYYADSLAGNHTANGDIYDPNAFTGAHKKLPFGTVVRVIREDTGSVTYVRINDRGPFGSADRIIDLSKAAAREIEMLRAGVVKVRVEVVSFPEEG